MLKLALLAGIVITIMTAGTARADSINIPMVDDKVLIEATAINLDYQLNASGGHLSVVGWMGVNIAALTNGATNPDPKIMFAMGEFSLEADIDSSYQHITGGTLKITDDFPVSLGVNDVTGTLFDASIRSGPNFEWSSVDASFLFSENGASQLSPTIAPGTPVAVVLASQGAAVTFDFTNSFSYSFSDLKADVYATVPLPSAAFGGLGLLFGLCVVSLYRNRSAWVR